jgi:hypothetical protein
MYPVRLGYDEAVKRINRLLSNKHDAESLVTSVFTMEKTFRRTLKHLIVRAGYGPKDADKLLDKFRGLQNIKDLWPLFDPEHGRLPAIIGNTHWQVFDNATKMRNELVHGVQVYNRSACRKTTKQVLTALEATRTTFNQRYGFDGWGKITSSK